MGQPVQVDTKRPLRVAKEGGEVTTVTNLASPTVYYKTGQLGESVSSSTKDGELTKGSSLQLSQTTFFAATEPGAVVEITAKSFFPAAGVEQGGGVIPLDRPNLLEFGALGDNKTDNTAAINNAIQSLARGKTVSPNGGTIYVPPGVYQHEGEINLKELTNVHLVGGGAQVGGGGIGVGEPLGATIFIYTGAGSRAWDFRSSVGCDLSGIQCFAWGSGFTGAIWDLSGTEAKPSALGHFINARAEATRVGGKTAEEIVACTGALLDYSNIHTFDACTFSSCEYGVKGIATANHSSVAHRFQSCFFAGNQKLHVANPQEAWEFNSCVAESLFNRKGVILNKAGFIGYTGAGFTSLGLNLQNCWSGSNVPAAREGPNVTFIGEGLNVEGGSYNTGEIGFYFKEGCVGNTIKGVRFWKLNLGILAETAKTKDSIIVGNRYTEIAEAGTNKFTAPANEFKGCIIQEANESALKVS